VRVADDNRLDIPDPSLVYTLEFRFRTKNPFGNYMQKGQTTTSGGQIKVQGPRGIVQCLFKGTARQVGTGSGRALNDNQWHTVTCVHRSRSTWTAPSWPRRTDLPEPSTTPARSPSVASSTATRSRRPATTTQATSTTRRSPGASRRAARPRLPSPLGGPWLEYLALSRAPTGVAAPATRMGEPQALGLTQTAPGPLCDRR
jgi:hypothetical protein